MKDENETKEEGILSPIQIGDLQKADGSRPHVSDDTFAAILTETGGRAAIVIALKDPVNGEEVSQPIHGFHITAVNVSLGFLPSILRVIGDALTGKLGGEITINKAPKP